MKQHHQNILAEQVRWGGTGYTKSDFLDAYNEISVRTMKKHTIKHAWEKAGLWPFNPKLVLDKMEAIEAPWRHDNNRFQTPEPEETLEPINWSLVDTPDRSLAAIEPYTKYIDHRLSSAINDTIPLTPTVSRVIDKRNKAQNIIVLNGVLSAEELAKTQAEIARKARHKKEGGQRRVATDHGVISKGDARLRLAGRAEFLEQEKVRRQAVIDRKIKQLGEYRWGVTARAAVRWQGKWQDKRIELVRRYKNVLQELDHFWRTGSRALVVLE